jgi:hypothetical protein
MNQAYLYIILRKLEEREHDDRLAQEPIAFTQNNIKEAVESSIFCNAYLPYRERYFNLEQIAKLRNVPLFEPDQSCAKGNFAYAALVKSVDRVIHDMKKGNNI